MADMMLGLDLGQLKDPSAAVALRRAVAFDERGYPHRDSLGELTYSYQVVGALRYPLGTAYESIVGYVAAELAKPDYRPVTRLVIDATGCGRPVLERFRTALAGHGHVEVIGIVITGGLAVTQTRRGEFNVSKTELVGALHSAMGLGRIAIPRRLEFADVIRQEAANFQVRVSKAANEIYSAREGQHDDLLIALAMPIWLGAQRWAAMHTPDLARERAALTAEQRELAAALGREAEAEEDRRRNPFRVRFGAGAAKAFLQALEGGRWS